MIKDDILFFVSISISPFVSRCFELWSQSTWISGEPLKTAQSFIVAPSSVITPWTGVENFGAFLDLRWKDILRKGSRIYPYLPLSKLANLKWAFNLLLCWVVFQHLISFHHTDFTAWVTFSNIIDSFHFELPLEAVCHFSDYQTRNVVTNTNNLKPFPGCQWDIIFKPVVDWNRISYWK